MDSEKPVYTLKWNDTGLYFNKHCSMKDNPKMHIFKLNSYISVTSKYTIFTQIKDRHAYEMTPLHNLQTLVMFMR